VEYTVQPGAAALPDSYAGNALEWKDDNGIPWELDGWYTADGTTKVLNADGTICAAVSGITTGGPGSYSFSGGMSTLYAKWKKSVYTPADGLSVGSTYVLLCQIGGKWHLVNESSKPFTPYGFETNADPMVTVYGDGVQYVFSKDVPATAVWTASENSTEGANHPGFYLTHMTNASTPEIRYLAQKGSTLRVFTKDDFTDTNDNATNWHYTDNIVEGEQDRYVYWSSAFKVIKNDHKNDVRLFVLSEDSAFES
jgi:hypothetical protein